MLNWSSNYYEGLDEFQHQTNDMWFYRMRQLLNDAVSYTHLTLPTNREV